MRPILGFAMGAIAAIAVAAPASAQGGCTLEIIGPDPEGHTYLMVGSGFMAGEVVTFEVLFDGRPIVSPFVSAANSDGSVSESVAPESDGPRGVYTVRTTSESCSARATFKWGMPDTAAEPLAIAAAPVSTAFIAVLVAGALAFVHFLRHPIRAVRHQMRSGVAASSNSLTGARLTSPLSSLRSNPASQRGNRATFAAGILATGALIAVLLALVIPVVRSRTTQKLSTKRSRS